MINEVLQWVVILFMGVFVVGLTRQLGIFLVPTREMRANDEGPALGKPLPLDLLEADDQAQLAEMMESRDSTFAFAAFIDEFCPGCAALVDQFQEQGTPEGVPAVALVRAASDDYRAKIEERFDFVVIDRPRMVRHGFSSAPLLMVLDRELRIVHKEIAADGHAVVAKWQAQNGLEPLEDRMPAMTLTQVNGGGRS